jgi:hypothetical protein
MENPQGFANVVVFQTVQNPLIPPRDLFRRLPGGIASVMCCGFGSNLVSRMISHGVDPVMG